MCSGFCSAIQHSTEMLCIILILWYNCLYCILSLYCILCSLYHFQRLSWSFKSYKPQFAILLFHLHCSLIIQLLIQIWGIFFCKVVIMKMCSFLLSCNSALLVFSFKAASTNLCPLAKESSWALDTFFWFFFLLFCHCSQSHLKDLGYFSIHKIK